MTGGREAGLSVFKESQSLSTAEVAAPTGPRSPDIAHLTGQGADTNPNNSGALIQISGRQK